MDRFPMRLKGSSMVQSLAVSFLIFALLGTLVLHNAYQKLIQDRFFHEELAYENMLSGLNLFLYQKGNIGDSTAFQLYGSNADSCFVQSEYWGSLGLVHVLGKHAKSISQGSCFIGQKPHGIRQSSLFLVDQKQPLVLVGKTRIHGGTYLPTAGPKAGFIGARSYEGDSLLYGNQKNSKDIDIQRDTKNLTWITDFLKEIEMDSAYAETYFIRRKKFIRTWQDSILFIRSKSHIILRDNDIHGKIILITPGDVRIEKNNRVQDAIIFAKNIYIEQGFIGRLQTYALGQIRVEEKVELNYPSVLWLSKTEDLPAYIEIGKESEVAGAVVLDVDVFGAEWDREDYCHIAPGAKIYGSVEAQHNLDIKGSVIGNVITTNFVLRTASAVYRNHLLDAYLDQTKLHRDYTMPLFQQGKHYRVIRWVDENHSEQ